MKAESTHPNAKFPAAGAAVGTGAAAAHHRDRGAATAGIETGGAPDFAGELARALVPAPGAPETHAQSIELTSGAARQDRAAAAPVAAAGAPREKPATASVPRTETHAPAPNAVRGSGVTPKLTTTTATAATTTTATTTASKFTFTASPARVPTTGAPESRGSAAEARRAAESLPAGELDQAPQPTSIPVASFGQTDNHAAADTDLPEAPTQAGAEDALSGEARASIVVAASDGLDVPVPAGEWTRARDTRVTRAEARTAPSEAVSSPRSIETAAASGPSTATVAVSAAAPAPATTPTPAPASVLVKHLPATPRIADDHLAARPQLPRVEHARTLPAPVAGSAPRRTPEPRRAGGEHISDTLAFGTAPNADRPFKEAPSVSSAPISAPISARASARARASAPISAPISAPVSPPSSPPPSAPRHAGEVVAGVPMRRNDPTATHSIMSAAPVGPKRSDARAPMRTGDSVAPPAAMPLPADRHGSPRASDDIKEAAATIDLPVPPPVPPRPSTATATATARSTAASASASVRFAHALANAAVFAPSGTEARPRAGADVMRAGDAERPRAGGVVARRAPSPGADRVAATEPATSLVNPIAPAPVAPTASADPTTPVPAPAHRSPDPAAAAPSVARDRSIHAKPAYPGFAPAATRAPRAAAAGARAPISMTPPNPPMNPKVAAVELAAAAAPEAEPARPARITVVTSQPGRPLKAPPRPSHHAGADPARAPRPLDAAAPSPQAAPSPPGVAPVAAPSQSSSPAPSSLSAPPSVAPALPSGTAPAASRRARPMLPVGVTVARGGRPAPASPPAPESAVAVDQSAPAPVAAPAAVVARASAGEASADLRLQARPLAKAAPAERVEDFDRDIDTAHAADKSESTSRAPAPPRARAAAPVDLAALVGAAPAVMAAPHRHGAVERPAAAAGSVHAAAHAGGHRAASGAAAAPSGRELRPIPGASDAAVPAAAASPRPGIDATNTTDASGHLSTAAALPASLSSLTPSPLPAPAPLPVPFDAMLAALPQAAPLPAAPGALLAHAAEDLSLRATLMPEHAVLSIDAGAAGELALHLRVKDGVADVRAIGASAHEMRPAELRAALASEGLTLGSFESGHSAADHAPPGSQRPDDDLTVTRAAARVAPGAAAHAANEPSSAAVIGRGVHVTA